MVVLVTGGAGYIGSHMVLALRDAGRDVVVLDDLSTGIASAVPGDVPFVQGSCGDANLLAKVLDEHRISAVLHFAASTVVPESVIDPLKYYSNNTANLVTLLASCVKAGVRNVVFSSTAAVYGNGSDVALSEDAPLNPTSPYGMSKLMSETILRDVSAACGLRHVIFRYFNVAGADPLGRTGQCTPNATHLIKVACQAALGQRDKFELFGTDYDTRDGTCVRDFVHVSDLVEAHLLALVHLEKGGESATFNCGYGRGYTVREVLEAVRAASGRDFPIENSGRRKGDPCISIADGTRLRTRLGWQPRHEDLDSIVASAFAWEARLESDLGGQRAL